MEKQSYMVVLNYSKGLNLDKVMLACYEENEPSRRTIIKCGGKLEKEFLYSDGKYVQVFWLQSSLQISPFEQVNVLKSIFEDIILTQYTTVLKDVMMIKGSTNYQLYGKTGTGAEAQSISTNILNNEYFK